MKKINKYLYIIFSILLVIPSIFYLYQKGTKPKLINYLMFSGFVYISFSALFQYDLIQGFLSAGREGSINQLILYNYFYIFLFNAAFYYTTDIFDVDFAKLKDKKMRRQ